MEILTIEAIKQLPTELLQQLRTDMELNLAKIRGQLEAAEAAVHISGEYADPDWYRRAKGALRFKGIEHQNILRELGARKRTELDDRQNSQGQAFIRAAKRRLDRALFLELLQEANDDVKDLQPV